MTRTSMVAFQFFFIQFYESDTFIGDSFIPKHIKINMQTGLAKYMENVR